MTATLAVEDLRVEIDTDEGPVLAVAGASFHLDPGEVVALVGESGCGKSMTAMAIMRLLPPGARMRGSIRLEELEITGLSSRQMREVRGRDVSIVFQEPMTSLNPSLTVGYQVGEVLRRHQGLSRHVARSRVLELLELVRMPAPQSRIDEYPHQMSGGMRQRVLIAMAVACKPKVLIADEPTTALDVTIQAQILDIIRDLRAEMDSSILLITHDLGVVADIADRVEVMYAGHRVESGGVDDLFRDPQHPYTMGLLGAVPRLDLEGVSRETRLQEIPGLVPTLRRAPTSCVFAPRCPRSDTRCHREVPPLETIAPGQQAACFYPGARRPPADAGARRAGEAGEAREAREAREAGP